VEEGRHRVLDDEGRRRLEMAYREFGNDVWRAILAYAGGRRDVADDAVAEAFAQAGRRLKDIRSLRPWVFRAAFRLARAELGRVRGTIPLEGVDAAIAPATEVSDVLGHLDRLSPRQRRTFVLRDVLGCSTGETAELLGSSEISVRVHLHAARRRLRDVLRMEDPG
jgi:RNA polymerase sigma-70 factor (ECF subfamily)